jgi:hypothetical protein
VKTVHKYPLRLIDGDQEIEMPVLAQILRVAVQYGTPCIWALVDPSYEKLTRRFRVCGTGWPIDIDAIGHVGSFEHMVSSTSLIFHVFENLAVKP